MAIRKYKYQGGGFIKNGANIITSTRIIFAIAMVLVIPFSVPFWIFYILGGLSDFLDGFVARKGKQQSKAGAKFDSIADMVFAIAIAIIVIKNIHISAWIWICIVVITLLRGVAYGIVLYKYRTFASLHTFLNKVSGVLIFIFPLLYVLLGFNISGIIIFIAAFLSSLEEVLIILKSKDLNRDCKGIFMEYIYPQIMDK